MKPIFFSCLFLGMLLLNNVAHAEGGCPAGMIPYSGNDINSCGPVPANYYGDQQHGQRQTQAPAAQWATQWGAIATDSVRGTLGAVSGLPSKIAAQQAAMADCLAKGGAPCKADIAYDNECVAMAVGSNGYNVDAAATLDRATKLAMNTCSAGTSNCNIYYSACSLPVRIH